MVLTPARLQLFDQRPAHRRRRRRTAPADSWYSALLRLFNGKPAIDEPTTADADLAPVVTRSAESS